MSREWDRAARDRLRSTLSLGRRWRVRTELTAAIRAVSRVTEAARLSVSGRAKACGAATTATRTTARTDSAPRRLIRSAVFYQVDRTEPARGVTTTDEKCALSEEKWFGPARSGDDRPSDWLSANLPTGRARLEIAR